MARITIKTKILCINKPYTTTESCNSESGQKLFYGYMIYRRRLYVCTPYVIYVSLYCMYLYCMTNARNPGTRVKLNRKGVSIAVTSITFWLYNKWALNVEGLSYGGLNYEEFYLGPLKKLKETLISSTQCKVL